MADDRPPYDAKRHQYYLPRGVQGTSPSLWLMVFAVLIGCGLIVWLFPPLDLSIFPQVP